MKKTFKNLVDSFIVWFVYDHGYVYFIITLVVLALALVGIIIANSTEAVEESNFSLIHFLNIQRVVKMIKMH